MTKSKNIKLISLTCLEEACANGTGPLERLCDASVIGTSPEMVAEELKIFLDEITFT